MGEKASWMQRDSVIMGQRGYMCFLQRDKCKRSGGVKRPNWDSPCVIFKNSNTSCLRLYCSDDLLSVHSSSSWIHGTMTIVPKGCDSGFIKWQFWCRYRRQREIRMPQKICTVVALLEELCTINAAEAERQPDKWKTNVNEKKNPEGRQGKLVRSTVVFTHYTFSWVKKAHSSIMLWFSDSSATKQAQSMRKILVFVELTLADFCLVSPSPSFLFLKRRQGVKYWYQAHL